MDDLFVYAKQFANFLYLYIEQIGLLSLKTISQKQRKSRQFLKDTIMTPFFLLAFITYVLYSSTMIPKVDVVYDLFKPPPLTNDEPWGIFNVESKGNIITDMLSKRLYYCPNDHQGINDLMSALHHKYPDIKLVGLKSPEDVLSTYEENMFDTWAAIEFSLSDSQLASGSLIDINSKSNVKYDIFINPTNWGSGLSTYNYTEDAYNDIWTETDLFWRSGLITLESFIANYLSSQYNPNNYKSVMIIIYIFNSSFYLFNTLF